MPSLEASVGMLQREDPSTHPAVSHFISNGQLWETSYDRSLSPENSSHEPSCREASGLRSGAASVKHLQKKCRRKRQSVTPMRFYCSLLCNVVLTAIIIALAMVLSVRLPENQRESRVPEVRMCSSCPRDWIGFGNKCFYFSEDIRNWTSSQAFCEAVGANLAQFDSMEELNFLKRHKGPDDHWLGLWRESAQHSWKWANHTEFSNFVEVRGAGEGAYLNQNGISSARVYMGRKWICSKLSSSTQCPGPSSSVLHQASL